ncbi:metallophosphoesterase [Shinella zoogloeoides]|uniref:metallophosphoesterase family protein n=1 Tax=Shinella zoogloeoides TaxID=352475 RepID=UPI00299D2D4D|nr:metallophosphoesterase [Shinella zoogloeoides]WPE23269.1 hypothetical protein ShzoTeo12_44880 [Shinella zoogloeoides]
MHQRFAIIADPHLHNVRGNYRGGRIAADRLPGGMELRTLVDTVQSTRLFNESEAGFRAVLDDIAARGIRHVIVVGDYSDDGQDESVAASLALMQSYADRFGMRFFSTVGNHDVYGYSGRSLDRSFLLEDGASFLVSGSRPDSEGVLFNPAMRCRSYAESLPRGLGFFRDGAALHWETPFGVSDDLADRQYTLSSPDGRHERRFIDASYLVEPVEGVWLLSIDGNVFVPRDGDFDLAEEAFDDSTDAGYNALVAHRPYLLDWIADVSRRAERLGKRLIAFAHYPAVDPFDATLEDEQRLFGRTIFVRRTPSKDTAALLAKAGLRLHFSGHLHIDNVSQQDGIVNVAVPSTAGYPGGYRLLTLHDDGAELEAIRAAGLALDPAILSAYRREAEQSGLDVGDLLDAGDFGAFAIRHLREIVHHRFFAKEWTPEARAAIKRMTLADIAREGAGVALSPEQAARFAAIPAMRLVEAIYIARHNAAWSLEMPEDERATFDTLLDICGMPAGEGLAASLLRMFRRHFRKDDFRRLTFSRDWEIVTGSPETGAIRIAR